MDSSTPTTSNNSTSNNNTGNDTSNKSNGKRNVDSDLKSSIIEFMRDRPFLWDCKHLCYKDHKRREHEFRIFSQKIGHSIQEIKRVWHVLRTNFFRAHKLLLDRPQTGRVNGEKLWKYYLAMEYILEGTITDSDSHKDVRKTRSYKGVTKGGKSSRLVSAQKEVNTSNKNSNRNSNANVSNNSSLNINKSTSLNDISIEADDDHLYARSLTSTLKKFDSTTKEIIKLKFQEIIVSYMQQQRQQEQSQSHQSIDDKVKEHQDSKPPI